MGSGYEDVLLEMALTGPSLDTLSVFRVISERSPFGLRFRRMAYVERSENLEKARFAETVAKNRGVNVRLFASLEEAAGWLSLPQEHSNSAS